MSAYISPSFDASATQVSYAFLAYSFWIILCRKGHALMSEDGAEADIVPRRADRMRRLVSLHGATPRDRQQDRASYLLLNSLDRRQHHLT